MSDETTDWTEMREFKAVSLTDSYVLSWHCNEASLVLDIDLCLTVDHPFYEAPRRSGSLCIRPASLEFPNCSALTPDRDGAISVTAAETASEFGHGQISGLKRVGEGRYKLRGAFGTAVIVAARPLLRLGERSP